MVRGLGYLCCALVGFFGGLSLGAAKGWAKNPKILVLPVGSEGFAAEVLPGATRAIIEALRLRSGFDVVGPSEAREQKINLYQQGRACGEDVFCYVEIGNIFGSEGVLVVSVEEEQPLTLCVLELNRLDVRTATVLGKVVYRFQPSELEDVSALGARRLFTPPDARILFDGVVPGLSAKFYGEVVPFSRDEALLWWSGRWRIELSAPEHSTEIKLVRVRSGEDTILSAELRPRPIRADKLRSDKFAENGESIKHSGVAEVLEKDGAAKDITRAGFDAEGQLRDDVVRIAPLKPVRRRHWLARPLPWLVTGLGAAAVVGGTTAMVDAQSRFNALAGESRFDPQAASAEVAREQRDALRNQNTVGRVVLVSGVATLVAGLAWVLLFPENRH